MNRSRLLLAVVLGSLVLASLAIIPSDAYMAGQPDAGTYGGCGSTTLGAGCHSTAPASDASLSVVGFPQTYEAGKTYTVTVSLEGPEPTKATNTGGFFLGVSDGELSVPSATEGKARVFSKTTATHTAQGNDQRTWTLYWQAPAAGTVTVTAYGNAVNGNEVNDDGDHWAEQTLTVAGPGGESNGAPGPGLLFVGLAVALVAIARRER